MSVAGVLNEPCTVWFAVVGVRVGMNFLGVLHSVRMVLLRFGDVSGCAEWAVHSFLCVLQHCAVGFVKIWWCQWMCWMSRAQCDLLSLVWELDMTFSVCSTQCAHGLVKIWWCQWLVCWMSRAQCDLLVVGVRVGLNFLWCSTQCAHGFVKVWWCQWLVCWMSRAQCDLLLVAW